jgi:hypothetical protein
MSTGRNRLASRAIAAALPVLMIAAGAVAGEKARRDDRRTIEVSGQNTIIVKNGRGQTVIVGDANESRVTIVADMQVNASDADEAKRLMAQLHYDVTEGKDEIVVETKRPDQKTERRGLLSILRGSPATAFIDYTIEVPKGFGAVSWTTSGDVRISNVRGDVELHGTSGDISLREVGGMVKVEVTSGNIEAKDIGGDLRILSSSGDAVVDRIHGGFVMQATSGDADAKRVSGDCQVQLITGDLALKGCLGNVQFQTSTGDAEVTDVEGGVTATTASGKLDVQIVPVGDKQFVLSSSSGDINVFYAAPKHYGFLLDVATGTGSIEGDLAIKVEEINRRRLKGVVGSGQSRVIIETASGDVRINETKSNGKKK